MNSARTCIYTYIHTRTTPQAQLESSHAENKRLMSEYAQAESRRKQEMNVLSSSLSLLNHDLEEQRALAASEKAALRDTFVLTHVRAMAARARSRFISRAMAVFQECTIPIRLAECMDARARRLRMSRFFMCYWRQACARARTLRRCTRHRRNVLLLRALLHMKNNVRMMASHTRTAQRMCMRRNPAMCARTWATWTNSVKRVRLWSRGENHGVHVVCRKTVRLWRDATAHQRRRGVILLRAAARTQKSVLASWRAHVACLRYGVSQLERNWRETCAGIRIFGAWLAWKTACMGHGTVASFVTARHGAILARMVQKFDQDRGLYRGVTGCLRVWRTYALRARKLRVGAVRMRIRCNRGVVKGAMRDWKLACEEAVRNANVRVFSCGCVYVCIHLCVCCSCAR